MFRYVMPEFQAKRLLRAEMLEQLRDYPKTMAGLALAGYCDGIVTGGTPGWDQGVLTVSPGMLYWKGKLYFQETPASLPCGPMDRMQYLKVRFTDEQREAGQMSGTGEILLETVETDPARELELCRFFLQEGARLRVEHERFEDFSTRYDTVNVLHVPYAAYGESAMAPVMLKQYATELLELKTENVYDAAFAMNILAREGRIPAACVREYLKARLDLPKAEPLSGGEELYRHLLSALGRVKRGERSTGVQGQGRREIRLV